MENIITNIPKNETNLNKLEKNLKDYSVKNLKTIIDFQKIYTNEIQNKIFFILNITNNQNKRNHTKNMMDFIQTILTNYITNIKGYYITLYIKLYNKKLSELLKNESPDNIKANFSCLKNNILSSLNDNKLITDNIKRTNFLNEYNKFINQLQNIKNLNENINSIITDLKTELINTYSAFLESKNNLGTNYIPQNQRISITNQEFSVENPFNRMQLNNNKSSINNKIKDKAKNLMNSIQSKIEEYIVIKGSISDCIKTIIKNLPIAINKKSFINKNSSSFKNFKSKIEVLKNSSEIILSELNNTNFKVELNELNTLLKKLIGTYTGNGTGNGTGATGNGTGGTGATGNDPAFVVPQAGIKPGNTSEKNYAIPKPPSKNGTITKIYFTKEEIINLMEQKKEQIMKSQSKQNIKNKIKEEWDVKIDKFNKTGTLPVGLSLTQNGLRLQGGSKK